LETFLIKAAQLILAFAILVIIHEFGHFLFARIFGVRVEKFYIFFDPWFELLKWKPKKYFGIFGKSVRRSSDKDDTAAGQSKNKFWGDTEYGVGWLPLGGYCKISGMIDESMDTEQMKQPPKPYEFRTKPAWQRLLIMIAGVLFNFLLAIFIYAGITWWWGDDYVPFSETKGLMRYSDAAQAQGFRDGDIPLTADGSPVDNMSHMFDLGSASRVQVLRGNDTVSLSLPKDFMLKLEKGAENDSRGIAFMDLDVPVVVHSISNASSRKAGLREGDEIIAMNDTSARGASVFLKSIEGRANRTVDIKVARRNGDTSDTLNLPIKLDGASKIGFQLENDIRKLYNVKTVRYGFFESFPIGISKGSRKMADYVSSLKYVFTKDGAKSVGGFGAIGSMFPEKWNWFAFWNIAAFLSVALAFMNILPIPGLDGGHVFFLLYEVILRRKPSDKFMERAQMTGMMLLLALLLYANGMDIIRFFFK
jgi:regulator of sigma E protease